MNDAPPPRTGKTDEPVRLLPRTLLRSARRSAWAHLGQTLLAILGVGLGVAVAVGIDLANGSARRAFALSTESITGRATHQITGGPQGLPDELFARVVLEAGARPAAPVVDAWVTALPQGSPPEVPVTSDRDSTVGSEVPGTSEQGLTGAANASLTLRLLGVDPLSEAPFRSQLARLSRLSTFGDGQGLLSPLLTRPGAGVLSSTTAERLGVAVGERFSLEVDGLEQEVTLVGVLDPEDEGQARALADLLVTDLSTAQELLDRVGRLDRIDLLLPEEDPATAATLEAVRGLLPAGARLERPEARTRATEEMTRAFRLNLTALAWLALVCGMFLIYNTTTFSVVQRRSLLGTYRSLGVTRREIFALILAEALVLAVAGTALGLALGVALGQVLVELVTRTINDLYFVVRVRELDLDPWIFAKGLALGLGATLVAALPAAWEAASSPPRTALLRSTLEDRARRAVPRAALAGGLLLALGLGLFLLPSRSLAVAFAGLFAVILGCALVTPGATVVLMGLFSRPAAALGRLFGPAILGRMAARGVTASLSRTGVAIAALVIAVSVTVGVGVMIDSFRGTVVRWLGQTLAADVYVTPPGPSAGRPSAGEIEPQVLELLAGAPGVARMNRLRSARVAAPVAGEAPGEVPPEVLVVAVDLDRRGRESFTLLETSSGSGNSAATFKNKARNSAATFQNSAATFGNSAATFRDSRNSAATWEGVAAGGVLLSEPFAYRRQLGVGDEVLLTTARGVRPFPVAGVYADYGNEQGAVLMDLSTYQELWDDRSISAVSLFAAPGASVDDLVTDLRTATGGSQRLVIRSNRALRETSLEIFDRTFAVTGVLRLVAALVAFIGVLAALMALQLERSRELGVLRANGMTPAQVGGLVTAETGLMGLAAGLLAAPVGVLLAVIMVHVINQRSFGWTLEMTVAPQVLGEALLLALAAALLAGVYPAWVMARTSPAEALRSE